MRKKPAARSSGEGARKSCVVIGHSMRFFLRDGDEVCFDNSAEAGIGRPVVLFDPRKPDREKYVVHRLLWQAADRRWTRGDWSPEWDSAECIQLGTLTALQRNGVRIPWEGRISRIWDAVFFVGARSVFNLERGTWAVWERCLKLSTQGRGRRALFARRLLLGIWPGVMAVHRKLLNFFDAAADWVLAAHLALAGRAP